MDREQSRARDIGHAQRLSDFVLRIVGLRDQVRLLTVRYPENWNASAIDR